jgi:DEAD/DEAH box helicase domain-containing protein
MGERIVLDLETQREFSEVEGRRTDLLGVSVVGIYRYDTNQYQAFLEAELSHLATLLLEAELVIGFNINKFDLPVLAPYLPYPISQVPTLDILDELVKALGHRVSLDSVAKATLGRGKTGSGLDALKWFKEGQFDLIKQYCLEDVRITKDVYEHGKQHGRLFITSRFGPDKIAVPVIFTDRKRDGAAILKMLQETYAKRLQVEIAYLAQTVSSGQSSQQTRRVEIYALHEDYFEGFCHLRQDVRQFRIDRVLDVKPVWQRYAIPDDYVAATIPE